MANADIARSLARYVIEIESPSEIVLIDDYNSESSSMGTTSKGPLGFGAEATVALLLPIVFKFFEKFLDRIANRAADDVYDAARNWLTAPDNNLDVQIRQLVRNELASAGLVEPQLSTASASILCALRGEREVISGKRAR